MKKILLFAVALALPQLFSCNKDKKADDPGSSSIPTGESYDNATTFIANDMWASFNGDNTFLAGTTPLTKALPDLPENYLSWGKYTYADGKYTMLDDHDKEVASVQVIDKENVKITILGTEYNRSVTVTKPSTEGQRAANHTWKVESFTLVYRSGTYNSTGSVDLNAIDDSFSKDLVMDKVIISDAVVVFPFKNEKVFAAQIPNGVDLSNFKMSQLTIQGTDEIPFFEGTASISFSWGKCVISIVGTYDGAPATAVLTLAL